MFINDRYTKIGFFLPTHSKNATIRRKSDGTVELKTKSRWPFGSGNDRVQIDRIGPNAYQVMVNGERHVFNRAEMSRLKIDTGRGNDDVIVGPGVDIPLNLDTGSGNDRVLNMSNHVSMNLGDGHDQAWSFGYGNRIDGGRGFDSVVAFGSHNLVSAEHGWRGVGSPCSWHHRPAIFPRGARHRHPMRYGWRRSLELMLRSMIWRCRG